jgi:hypothetical protein
VQCGVRILQQTSTLLESVNDLGDVCSAWISSAWAREWRANETCCFSDCGLEV